MSRTVDRRFLFESLFGTLLGSSAIQVCILSVTIIFCGVTLAASSPSTSSSSGSSTARSLGSSADQICAPRGGAASCVPALPTDLDPAEVEMWQLVNQDRSAVSSADETKGRARPLQWDARLATVARTHSREMATDGFFSHQGADGSPPWVRISRVGVHWLASGENIAKFPEVREAEAAFMNEPKFQPNHRANILNPDYTHVGVGIVKGPDGMLYITQEFAQIR